MTFTNSKILKNLNGKLYMHKSGERVYSTQKYMTECITNAFDNSPVPSTNFYDYFISILWSDSENNEMMDFFGFEGLKKNWKANPDVQSWVIKNGVWMHDNPFTCGEGIILLGKEEELRRKTKNIEEYIKSTVDLDSINKILSQ